MVNSIRFFIVTIILLFVLESNSQNTKFQGEIVYDLDYVDKTRKMSENEVKQYLGTEQRYFIKENKYKSVMNGALELTQFYTGRDTLYNAMKGVNTLMYLDAKMQDEEIVSYEIKKNQTTILGYSCDLIEIETSDGTMKYYYNNSIRVDQNLYENHKKGFWYFCLNNANGALPLKLVTNTSKLKLTIEANKVDFKVLEDSIFDLPKDLLIVKSPE